MEQRDVSLMLTRAEALVLFEMLARNESDEVLAINEPAEQQVLWKLEGQLERTLTEPLQPDYEALLAEARRSVRAS